MKTIFIFLSKCIALLVLLMVGMGKVNGQECNLDNKAKTVGVIPYSDDFITQEEVMERNYAITSFRMIDTATVAVLTGASDMILVYSFTDNQILYKIQLPISARAFDYDNGLFHAIGDRTYLSIDSEGMIHEKKDFQEPKLLNEEIFIITDLKVIDGQPIVHESNSNTYSITSDGLQEIDTFYYHYTRGCKIHPQYIDENSFILYNETPSKSGSFNVSMGSLGLEGKLSCIEYISVDDDYTAINIETSHNRTGRFVKSYLLVVNSNGELINLVEVPINFLSYIQRPFIYKDNAWYYAFSGQEGITIFKIGTNTNRIDSPDSIILSDDNFDDSLLETNNGISYEDTTINNPTRGNWRTITQAWYNAHEYCAMEWTPIPDNVTTTCTWISGSGAGYIITPITSYYYTEIGVPYKWYGFTDHVSFEELASEGKYTGNRITTSSCGGSAYLNVSDTYVIGVDCSGFVSRCLELSSHTGTGQIASSSDFTNYGSVVGASSSVFQKGDALNKTGDPGHVRLYTGHTSDGQITVFESSGSPDWKTHSATYRTSDFSGYNIMRYNYMRNIILRLNGNIELIQNGSVVSNVTQGQPLTVNYSVTNAGSETWSGYVSLWIEQSDGNFMCIQENEFTPIYAGGTESFTFSNSGVSSPVGTTKFYVRVRNYNAGGYNRAYDVGSLTNSNPLEFQIVGGSSGGGNCDYDELWTLHKVDVGEWSYKTSSISSGGCRVYRVVLLSSNTFTFQTCYPGDANFDTKLSLYDSNCNFIMEDDDGCTGNLSSLEFTNTGGNAFYYLKIEGFGSNSGSFTIAAKREEPSTSYVINASAIPSSGGTVGGAGTYQSGSTCNLTASPNAGYFFSYWSKNNSQVSTNASYSFTVTESASYEAHFGLNNYTITATASPSAGGTVSGGGTYSYGSNCTLTASPATGYSFVRWTRNGSQVSTNPSYSFTVTSNASYVAEFSQNSYTISVSSIPSSGGTVSGGGTYNYGSNCNLTASPNAGYFFSYWSKNNSQVSTNASYSFTVTESASYEAHFGLNNYTITATASPSAGGTVSGGGTYSYGSNCTLTASPATGYSFVRWTRNGSQVSTNPSYSFTVTSNASYVAEFSQNSYTISVSSIPSSGGTVSGGGTYNYGSNCNLTASPNAGYFFSYWSKNNSQVSTNASYSFTVTESASYEAHFGLNNYTITATASPSAGGTVSGGGTYSHGSLCTLTATPSASYTFVNWTENESEVSTDATYSFTVTGNRTLVANFAIAQTEFHWTPNDSQYANTMTAIAIIQIDGVEQRTTALELGAFCGNECRGRQLLVYYPQVDRYLLFLDIYGNDGDALSFRLYDHGTGQESNLTCSTSETFVSNATLGSVASPYVFSFTNAITQTTTMPLGWSWWSPAVEVEGEDGLAQLEESLGDNGIMIKSRLNGFVSNYGGMWMGSLTSISSEQTYLIQTAAACEMSLTGSAPLPTSHAISLAPGWNWIGYPLGESMSVSTALSGITPTENDMLKSRDYGFTIYYPGFGWMGSLNTVEPGMGLMYESHNNQTITLTYPETVKSESLKQNLMARGDHWMPVTHPYPNNMTVLAVVELDNVELQSDHYELGVFVGDECRGSAKLVYEAAMNRYVAYLAIYGEEPMPLHFGLYDTESGEEHFDADVELVFGPNATYGIPTAPYVVRFRSTTGVEEQGIRASVFPNPVDRGQTLWIGLEASEGNPIRMEIVNELGAIVSTETVYKTPATIQAPNTAGVYLLRITVEGEGSCYRKLVVRR